MEKFSSLGDLKLFINKNKYNTPNIIKVKDMVFIKDYINMDYGFMRYGNKDKFGLKIYLFKDGIKVELVYGIELYKYIKYIQ